MYVRSGILSPNNVQLGYALPICNEFTAACLLQVRDIVKEMSELLLVKQDPYQSYELEEFLAKQVKNASTTQYQQLRQDLRKQYMLEALNKMLHNIASLVLKACQQVVEQNNGPFRIIETYEQEKEERNLRRLKYCEEVCRKRRTNTSSCSHTPGAVPNNQCPVRYRWGEYIPPPYDHPRQRTDYPESALVQTGIHQGRRRG